MVYGVARTLNVVVVSVQQEPRLQSPGARIFQSQIYQSWIRHQPYHPSHVGLFMRIVSYRKKYYSIVEYSIVSYSP